MKKSREYNSSDLTSALYNIDNNKKGLYCGYMDGNSDLMDVARPNLQTSPGWSPQYHGLRVSQSYCLVACCVEVAADFRAEPQKPFYQKSVVTRRQQAATSHDWLIREL